MKHLEGLGFDLDDSNPDTPKIVNPITGNGQRATYTDVLLFTLIERIETLIEVMGGGDRAPAPEPAPVPEQHQPEVLSLAPAPAPETEPQPQPETEPQPQPDSPLAVALKEKGLDRTPEPELVDDDSPTPEPVEELKPPRRAGRHNRKTPTTEET